MDAYGRPPMETPLRLRDHPGLVQGGVGMLRGTGDSLTWKWKIVLSFIFTVYIFCILFVISIPILYFQY